MDGNGSAASDRPSGTLRTLCDSAKDSLSASVVACLVTPGGGEPVPGGELVERAVTGNRLPGELLRQLEAGPWRERPALWSRPAVLPDMRLRGRWPALRRAALEGGVLSLAIAPLRAGPLDCLGVLAVGHATTGGVATSEDRAVLQTVADCAGGHERMARQLHEARHLALQLEAALATRVVVEQAKGFLAARLRLSPEHAFEVMRGYARPRNRTVHGVARALLDGALDPAALVRSQPGTLAPSQRHRSQRR